MEFPLEEGGSIVVEADEPETGGAGREDKIEKVGEAFPSGRLMRNWSVYVRYWLLKIHFIWQNCIVNKTTREQHKVYSQPIVSC